MQASPNAVHNTTLVMLREYTRGSWQELPTIALFVAG
jgi:hypothetical protein